MNKISYFLGGGRTPNMNIPNIPMGEKIKSNALSPTHPSTHPPTHPSIVVPRNFETQGSHLTIPSEDTHSGIAQQNLPPNPSNLRIDDQPYAIAGIELWVLGFGFWVFKI
jgi:hypothetical protein